MKKLKYFATIIMSICAFSTSSKAFANHPQNNRKQLQKINQSIIHLKQNIHLSEEEKAKIQTQLQATESSIGNSAKQLQQINSQLTQTKSKLRANLIKQQQLSQQLATEKYLFNEYIQSAYMLERQPYLKVLLNQENPAVISRYLHYYHALLQAHLQMMQKIQTTMQNLQIVETNVRQQSVQLSHYQVQQLNQTNALKVERAQRSIILKQINQSLSSKREQLQKLIEDKNRLGNLLQQVEAPASQQFITPGALGGPFAKNQGKLGWPVNSRRLLQNFNQPLIDGKLHTTGIFIQANTGAPIYAVFPGRVVFAQWLRGYGLLAIIQHGSNFMTLYAHAESLNVNVGSVVKAGDVIGAVGNSGGFEQNGLYFEIRHGSTPLNPLAWLKR